MTYQNDPTPPGSGPLNGNNERSTRMVWATLAVLAVLIVAGFMFYNSGGHGPQTASNNTPSVTQTNPSGPERTTPAPAPTTTPPTKM